MHSVVTLVLTNFPAANIFASLNNGWCYLGSAFTACNSCFSTSKQLVYEGGTSFLTTSRAVSRPKASFTYSRKMMESLVIFSTLPWNTWSFSLRKYVFLILLATTAIILPEVSFTVPCNTSSGITRHRLPLVQFGAGRVIPSLATMGLTNGSRRPCAPKALAEGFGFSAAACTAGAFCAVPGAGALGGTVTAGFLA